MDPDLGPLEYKSKFLNKFHQNLHQKIYHQIHKKFINTEEIENYKKFVNLVPIDREEFQKNPKM